MKYLCKRLNHNDVYGGRDKFVVNVDSVNDFDEYGLDTDGKELLEQAEEILSLNIGESISTAFPAIHGDEIIIFKRIE